MDKTTTETYIKYYFDQIYQYNWNCCTAFHLSTEEEVPPGHRVKKALSLKDCKSFIHRDILSPLKHKILVRDHNNELKRGIPFYAYYIICKELDDSCYHVHMLMSMQDEYFDNVNNYIGLVTGNVVKKLKAKVDVVKMIKYMLKKGNLVLNADRAEMLPVGYNLNIDKRHFRFSGD